MCAALLPAPPAPGTAMWAWEKAHPHGSVGISELHGWAALVSALGQ